jgi:energy-converting hydrogenase Eha subunit C
MCFCKPINLTNVIYVVECLVGMIAYRNTLEHIQAINLTNVIYVVECLVGMIAYRNTLEHILAINLINVIYVVVCILMCFCKLSFRLNTLPHISHL